MKYLFFDTESANCFGNIYKMCELGSLMSDENLNLLPGTKRDVLINPGKDGKFNLTGRKDGRDIKLAHTTEEYKNAPLFDDLYDNIHFLLTQKDVMIFLWAAKGDIQAVLDQCFRYHLAKIPFVAYDVQTLFRVAFPEDKRTPALEKAMDTLGLSRENIIAHRPDDDALMTMLVLKALCAKSGKTVQELIDECPGCKVDAIPTYAVLKKHHREKEERKRRQEARRKAMAPFNDALKEIFPQGIPEDVPVEKTYSVSLNMKLHIDETLALVKDWTAKGYWLKRSPGVRYFIAYDKEEAEALRTKLDTTNLIILTMAEFVVNVISS